MRLRALVAATAVAAFALACAGCGQRGPLYLRDNPPPGVKPEKRDTYKPIPYPRSTGEEESH
jgi:predicted small lipoprotein YifL